MCGFSGPIFVGYCHGIIPKSLEMVGRILVGGLVTVAGEHRVSKTGPPSTLRFVFVLVIQALPLAERYRRRWKISICELTHREGDWEEQQQPSTEHKKVLKIDTSPRLFFFSFLLFIFCTLQPSLLFTSFHYAESEKDARPHGLQAIC